MSIELLFSDEVVSNYCKQVPMAGGGQVPKFKDSKKAEFAEIVSLFEPLEFEAFKPLFKRLSDYACQD